MSRHGHAEHRYDDPDSPPRLCLNCSTPLRGPYCTQCGQHDVDYHRSFHHLVHDLLENLFHFEGKFFTSVAWLLAKPGKLTADFNAGRRQSQLNPLRFYIFVTVLFFLGVHLLNQGHLLPFDRAEVDAIGSDTRKNLAAIAQGSTGLTPKQAERFGELFGDAMEKKQGRMDQKTVTDIVERVRREIPEEAEVQSSKAGMDDPAKKPKRKPRSVEVDDSDFGRALKRKLDAGELTFSKILDELEHRAPTLLFLGMPVFALLVKLLYRRQQRYYIEHLIFSIHLHTWVFLVVMVSYGYFQLAALGPRLLTTLLAWTLVLWMAWYGLAAFRTVYGQSWVKTGVKLALLGSTYLMVMIGLTAAIIVGTVAWLVMR